ncbi:alcohol dehydrogenase [Crepidotus variabilis]|uniref:Alcohol dehydrogenase n=1 Tax=Crepidotus variabilis TaxID=179855 RepID=A0A9P6EKG1_9AGAR|nr:alcohol dehydrogenase [Crepidotus variabilis]
MAPVTNGRVILNAYAEGFPEPGKTIIYDDASIIDLDNVPLEGGVLIKTLELSVDPYFRNRMNPPPPPGQGTANGFTLGQPLHGGGVAVVLRSEDDRLKAGDKFFESFSLPHQHYSILKGSQLNGVEILKNPHNIPWSAFTGVLGMPGLSAYAGWKEHSKAKEGEVAFVTSGAGPVGSLVVQLAKIEGLKVIASAGSEEKLQFMRDLGADVVFNYKTTDTKEVLAKEGPIDIYWDNVGGETLDAALINANINARFIECGMISGYNNGHSKGIKNIYQVVARQISMNGFFVGRLGDKYRKEFLDFIEPKIANGEIKYAEDRFIGLEKVGEAIAQVQRGLVKAKAVVHVASENI